MTQGSPTWRGAQESPESNLFPRVILGTAALGGIRSAIDRGEAVQTILEALHGGIEMIDTAPSYGNAEDLVGEALAQWTGPSPLVSTKVGKYFEAGRYFHDYSPAATERAIHRSCLILGRGSLDCVYAHEPDKMTEAAKPEFVACMATMREKGITKKLGLGGGHGSSWDGLVETGVFQAAIVHGRLDAVTCMAADVDVPRLRRANMAVLGGSVLHKGLLGNRSQDYLKNQPAWLSPFAGKAVGKIQQLSSRVDIPIAALAHRFALSLREMDSVIIGPENRLQLRQTMKALEEGPLPRDVFEAICACQS